MSQRRRHEIDRLYRRAKSCIIKDKCSLKSTYDLSTRKAYRESLEKLKQESQHNEENKVLDWTEHYDTARVWNDEQYLLKQLSTGKRVLLLKKIYT